MFYLYSNEENNGLVNSLCKKINNNQKITLNGSKDGDLIHITHAEDCANFITHIMRKNISDFFDLAPERRISIRRLSESIAKKMNKNVEFVINKKEETSETKVNLDKIRKYTRRNKFRDPEIGLKGLYLSDN